MFAGVFSSSLKKNHIWRSAKGRKFIWVSFAFVFSFDHDLTMFFFKDKLVAEEIIEMSQLPDEFSDAIISEGAAEAISSENNETVVETSTPNVKKNLAAVYHPTTAILNFPRRKQ